MNNLIIRIALYSSVLNIIFTPFSSFIARIFGYLTIVLFFLAGFLSVYKPRKIIIEKNILFMFIALLLSFFINLRSFNFISIENTIDKIISIFSFVSFYIVISSEDYNNKFFSIENIFHINYVLCFSFFVFAFFPFDFKYQTINEYGDTIFSMGLGNPNATSLYVMFTIIVLMIQFNKIYKLVQKLLNLFLIIAMFYILILLSSRTVVVCTFIIILAFLLKYPKIYKWISYFIVLAPFFLLVLQLFITRFDKITVEILNKVIDTGRPQIYLDLLDDLFSSTSNFVFGNLHKNSFYNYHNGLLTIISSIGFLGVVFYVRFWNGQLKLLREKSMSNGQKIAFVAIIAIMLHSSSESMGVIGTIPYSIFVIIIMKIAKGEIKYHNE